MKKHKRSRTDAARRLEIVCSNSEKRPTCYGSARALRANTSAGERSKAESSEGGGDLGVQTLTPSADAPRNWDFAGKDNHGD